MKVRGVSLLCSALVISGCTTHHVARRIGQRDGDRLTSSGGVVYALPKTVLDVAVRVRRTERVRGRLADFADLYPDSIPNRSKIPPAASPKSLEYRVVEAVVSPRAIPDPDHLYALELDDGVFKDAEIKAQLDQAGVITNFDSTGARHEVAFAVEVIKTAAEIAGKVVGLPVGGVPAAAGGGPKVATTGGSVVNVLGKGDLCKGLSKEIPRLATCAVLVHAVPWGAIDAQDQAGLEHEALTMELLLLAVAQDQQPHDLNAADWQQAKQAVAANRAVLDQFTRSVLGAAAAHRALGQLDTVRRAIASLLNLSDTSEPVFKLQLSALRDQERSILATLSYAEEIKEGLVTFEVTPDGAGGSITANLFDLHPKQGIALGGAAVGVLLRSYPAEFLVTPPPAGPPTTVSLSVAMPTPALRTALLRAQPMEPWCGDTGFAYRIPAHGRAMVALSNGQTLASQDVGVGQWGVVAWLPASMWGTKGAQHVELHPTTGGLRSVHVSTQGLPPNALSGLGGAAGSLIDGLAARRKAEAEREAAKDAKADELNQLTREAALLEQRLKIKELRDKLGTE